MQQLFSAYLCGLFQIIYTLCFLMMSFIHAWILLTGSALRYFFCLLQIIGINIKQKEMMSKIRKVAKIAVLGAGTIGFAGLAYREYQKAQQKAKINGVTIASSQQGQVRENKEAVHVHDSDVRVLDMVGLPAVHGANILEQEHPQVHQQAKIIQKPDAQQVKQEAQKPIQPQPQPIAKPKQQPVPQQKPQLQINRISRKTLYKKLQQIPFLDNPDKLSSEQYVLLVIDPGYTSLFENELINKLTKTLKNRKSNQPLTIYRIDSHNAHLKQQLEQRYGMSIKEQDIYLMKNPYDKGFINVDFDLFLKHDKLPAIYLSQLKMALSADDLKKAIVKMTPNDTYLLMAIDSNDDNLVAKNKLIGKYVQMELGVQNYQNVKLCLVDHKEAIESGILSPTTKPNSLHLIRKNNQFTYKPPNRYLYKDIPYNVIENIMLQDKNHKIMIPRYMGKIETFTSLKLDSPYICVIQIDRNRITPKEERDILATLAAVKESQQFQNLSFVLKFGEVENKGSAQEPFSNRKWCLKLANVDEIDKHSFMHEIRGQQDAKSLGISQKNWMRDTYEYLYRDPEVTPEGLRTFFRRSMNGKQPQFFKTEAKHKLQHVEKLTSSTFDEKIFGQENSKYSHLVFQYSDHCIACQALSPIIEYFADVCSKFPQIGTNVHALNCDKNKVKGQPYSPYTPNLYLYSKNWKNKEPIRYPIIEYINHTNIWGIYDFCTITDRLAKVDVAKFEQHVKNVTESKVRLTDF